MSHRNKLTLCFTLWILTGCATTSGRWYGSSTPPPQGDAPYPRSALIEKIEWRLPPRNELVAAYGSDLWPTTWGADGELYASWGDGGGFDGAGTSQDVETNRGRVSLGFARISGVPTLNDLAAMQGHNFWGAHAALDCGPDRKQPCAENQATFGGKVGSVVAVDGVLYAVGSIWTGSNCGSGCDPLKMGEAGPLHALAWSTDGSRSWQIAPWADRAAFRGGFLNFGRDNSGALDSFVYLYYTRTSPDTHIYLKRVSRDALMTDPTTTPTYSYLTGVDQEGNPSGWSTREIDAAPVFTDPNYVTGPMVVYDAPIGRFLLTVGHNPKALQNENAWSAGQMGIFEAPHPWGPWATVGYYDDWGHLGNTAGDYLNVGIPSKWISDDGAAFWAVFSGVGPFTADGSTHLLDSLNLAHATLIVSSAIPSIKTPAADALVAGGTVTLEGTGKGLQWSATLLSNKLTDVSDQQPYASGNGRLFSFTVPAEATVRQLIRVRLTGGASDAAVYRDYVIGPAAP